MSWSSMPLSTGTDINAYAFVKQFWQAVQERNWGSMNPVWPRSNLAWGNGVVTGISDNGDGTYTVTDSNASWPVNRWFGYSQPDAPYIPANYDLIIDDPFDETQITHVSILGNTATTFKVTGQYIKDAITGKWITSTSVLVGRRYWIIKQGGEWWSERWIVWPNDSEAWVSTTLGGGATVPVKLTSSGTTATATFSATPSKSFQSGDSVTIANASSKNGKYNGTFSISNVTSTSFKYTLSGADSSPASGMATATCAFVGANDPKASYPSGKFKSGYELMVTGSDGALKRITLTGNDTHNLYFDRQTFTLANTQYAVIKAGQKWRYYNNSVSPAASTDNNPYAGPPFRWYHSLWEFFRSHYPDDSLSATPVPRVSLKQYSGPSCEDVTGVNIFDIDYWTALDDACNGFDKNYTPDLFRTIRDAIQLGIENVCGAYVKVQNYNGAQAIPTFVPATMFLTAGINAFTGTTGLVGTDGHGNAGITVSSIPLPTAAQNKLNLTGSIPVYYAILDSTGTPQNWNNAYGLATLTSNTFLTGNFTSCTGVTPPQWCDENKSLVIALGWTRNYPNEFAYMYDRTAFIPDVNTDGPNPVFADPPTTEYQGTWPTRKKSTKLKEHDGIGIVREQNGYRSFMSGDFCRYTGDNANDPTIHTALGGTNGLTVIGAGEISTDDGPIPDPSSYWDNFFEGTLSPKNQGAVVASTRGTATGGDSYHLEDTGKNWWPKGVMRTETGTATGGSTTSLSDSSKSGNAFWDATRGRWAGFVVEVQIAGTWYRRAITGMSGTTLSWSDPLPSSANGCQYQIREPRYILNRWAGRTLTVTLPKGGGTFKDIPILYSDDQNLYFAQQSFSISKGTAYQIVEYYPGGVWEWNGSKWIKPTGTDTRGGVKWLDNQNCNIPTYNTDYGHLMKGDYITETLFNELYAALNVLVWVKWQTGWTSRKNPAVCENNEDQPPGFSGDAPNYEDAKNGYTDNNGTYHSGAAQQWTQDLWTAAGPCQEPPNMPNPTPPYDVPDGIWDYSFESSSAPFAYAYGTNGATANCCYIYNMGRRYAYGTISGVLTYQQCGIDWYDYATVDGGTVQGPCSNTIFHWIDFDNEGDAVGYNVWTLFDSTAPSDLSGQGLDASLISNKLGSLNPPDDIGAVNDDCGQGDLGDGLGKRCLPQLLQQNNCSACDHWRGYEVTDQVGIIRWNVPLGFRFQP